MKIVPIKPKINDNALAVLEDITGQVKAGKIKAISVSYVTEKNSVCGDISEGEDNMLMLAAMENTLWHFKSNTFNQD